MDRHQDDSYIPKACLSVDKQVFKEESQPLSVTLISVSVTWKNSFDGTHMKINVA